MVELLTLLSPHFRGEISHMGYCITIVASMIGNVLLLKNKKKYK